jgi:hypothetical protein
MFAVDLNHFRLAQAASQVAGASSLMLDCKLSADPAFDNFPFRHVISNFCPSFASNLVEVQ